jgi:hypothetical protein
MLPEGELGYGASQLSPELVKKFAPYVFGTSASENKEQQEALEQLAAAGPRLKLSSFSVPLRGLNVLTFDDPGQADKAMLKLFQSLKPGSVFSAMLKDVPEVKQSVEKQRGFVLHSAKMTWDFDKMLNRPGAAATPPAVAKQVRASMEKMMGTSMTIWFGTDGKQFVQVFGPDWDMAKKELDAFLDKKSPIGDQAAYRDSRKQLPADTSMFVLVDLPQYAVVIGDMIQSIVGATGAPIPPGAFTPAAKGKTSFGGFAVTLQPQRADFDGWLPATAVNEIYKMYIAKWVNR